MSAPSGHINFALLADYVERRLSPGARARIEAHLAACAACTAEVAAITRLIGTMRADDTEEAPPHIAARAARLFQQRPQPRDQRLPERLLGKLRFDSGQRPQAFGVRSASSPARQLLFSAGDYELDLRLAPHDAQWVLAGQVLGPEASGSVELDGQGTTVDAPLSELGEFRLPPVPPGVYTLVLHLVGIDLLFPLLEVG